MAVFCSDRRPGFAGAVLWRWLGFGLVLGHIYSRLVTQNLLGFCIFISISSLSLLCGASSRVGYICAAGCALRSLLLVVRGVAGRWLVDYIDFYPIAILPKEIENFIIKIKVK